MKKDSGKGLRRPPDQAGSFPEKEYTESLKGDPPASEYAKPGTPNQTGPNSPGGGKSK
jgi:hypothetical protein